MSVCQLLGREYYQTVLSEPLLVWAPLAIHIGAATIKRSIVGPPKKPSKLGSTGWLLATALIPVHIVLHRLNPANATPPVLSLGPSQLDYEFVKVGLAVWPIMNWTLYSTLVVSAMLHATEGVVVIFRYWGRRAGSADTQASTGPEAKGRRQRSTRYAFVKNASASAGISTVLGGLALIATEPLNVSRAFMARIEASFMLESMFRRLR